MRPFAFFQAMLTALLLASLAGCVGTGMSAKSLDQMTPETEYILGPGDTLQIFVRNNPDLSVTLPIRPDGRISVPMVQDMTAAGKTPSELAADLEDSLAQFIRTPSVTVMVTSFVGAYQNQIKVVGQAVQPQSLPYRDGMTLLDVMIQVGGLTPFAAGDNAKLIRMEGGERVTYNVRLEDLINQGDITANVPMRPGDIIIIPESFF